MADEQKGRCVGCGYLSWRRHNDDSSPCYEVTEERRQSGERPDGGQLRDVSRAPYCFRLVPINKEFERENGTSGLNPPQVFLKVISADRVCPKFFSYHPGKSPEGHEILEGEMEHTKAIAEAAEGEEDKAERRHKADIIYRFREARRQRDWQDAKDAEQRDHEKVMARIQDERDEKTRDWQDGQAAKQWKRELTRIVLSGVGALGLSVLTFFAGQWVEQNKKAEKERQQDVAPTEQKK